MIIDKDAQEQREQMRRTAIANMAMELAKAFAAGGVISIGSQLAKHSLDAAEIIFNSAQPPVASLLHN